MGRILLAALAASAVFAGTALAQQPATAVSPDLAALVAQWQALNVQLGNVQGALKSVLQSYQAESSRADQATKEATYWHEYAKVLDKTLK